MTVACARPDCLTSRQMSSGTSANSQNQAG